MSKLYGGCNNNFHAQLPIMKKARNKIPSLSKRITKYWIPKFLFSQLALNLRPRLPKNLSLICVAISRPTVH